MKKILLFILGLGLLSSVSAETYVKRFPTDTAVGLETTLDPRYLKLDTSNDPLTGDLTLNNTDPALIFDPPTSGDTPFGFVNEGDEAGDDDDKFHLIKGTDKTTGQLVTVDKDGNVGIGTVAPSALLHLDEADAQIGLLVQGGSGGTTIARFQRDVGLTGIIDVKASGGDPQIKFNDEGGGVWAIGAKNTGDTFRIAQNSDIGTNDLMTIQQNGNVGIGTTDPDKRFEVNSAGANSVALFESTDSSANIYFKDNNTTSGDSVGIGAIGDELRFFSSSGTAVEMVRIDSAGKVGIGVTDPTAYLHLKAGTATASTAPLKFTAGTLLGTPETGTIEFASDKFYLTNVDTQRVIDRTSCVETTTTTVAETVVETTIYTCPIPANSLKVGNHLHVGCSGVMTNATASDDITIRIYVGTDEISSYKPAVLSLSADPWHVDLNTTVRTIGGSGTIASHGHVEIDGQGEANCELDTIDTTSANDITVTVEWDNSKAGNIISLYQGAAHWAN